MSSVGFAPKCATNRRLSLADIDAMVSARLGPTRTPGNAQPACFNRQMAMYLAKHVGGWSTTLIGRFYNGRDHSTVCYAIQRIESLRESDPDVDALITDLKQQLAVNEGETSGSDEANEHFRCIAAPSTTVTEFADLVAERVWAYLKARLVAGSTGVTQLQGAVSRQSESVCVEGDAVTDVLARG